MHLNISKQMNCNMDISMRRQIADAVQFDKLYTNPYADEATKNGRITFDVKASATISIRSLL